MTKRDEVLRYHIWGNREGDTEVEVGVDGEWVRYDDYTTLRELLAAVEAERDRFAIQAAQTLGMHKAQLVLAALREPSEAVVQAVKDTIYEELGIEYWDGKTRRILYYAIQQAEKEVGE